MTSKVKATRSFSDLGVSDKLVAALNKQGIATPFPIQVATLPDALEGHDILGQGKTGSGKTLAFGIALLNNIQKLKVEPRRPLALVLAPTRELAQQIDEVLFPLARALGHSSVVVAGGLSFKKQISALQRGVSVVVATPGRLIDLLNRRELRLDGIKVIVLDEADMMADMGFMPDMKLILDETNSDAQRMLFSATLERGVDKLVKTYLHKPRTHTVTPPEHEKVKMDHFVFIVESGQKSEIAQQIAARTGKTLLFVRTRHGADKLVLNLSKVGVHAGALHSGKSQAVRNRTLEAFKEKKSAVLVATDIAARGIHVDGIDLVVHVDVPADHKDYVHRSGRTARAGEVGTVVTLATKGQQKTILGIAAKASITPTVMAIKPLDKELIKITGAREPSGIPTEEEIPESIFLVDKPARGRKKSGSRDSKRSYEKKNSRSPRTSRGKETNIESRGSRSSRSSRTEKDDWAPRKKRGTDTEPRSARSKSSSKRYRDDETARDSRSSRTSQPTRGRRDERGTRTKREESKGSFSSKSSRRTQDGRRERDERKPRSRSSEVTKSRSPRSTSGSRRSEESSGARGSRSSRSKSGSRRSHDSNSRDARGTFRAAKSKSISKKRSGKPRPKNKSR